MRWSVRHQLLPRSEGILHRIGISFVLHYSLTIELSERYLAFTLSSPLPILNWLRLLYWANTSPSSVFLLNLHVFLESLEDFHRNNQQPVSRVLTLLVRLFEDIYRMCITILHLFSDFERIFKSDDHFSYFPDTQNKVHLDPSLNALPSWKCRPSAAIFVSIFSSSFELHTSVF